MTELRAMCGMDRGSRGDHDRSPCLQLCTWTTNGAGRIIERPERDPRPSGSRVSRHGFPWPDVVSRARLTVSYRSAHGWLMLRAHAQHR